MLFPFCKSLLSLLPLLHPSSLTLSFSICSDGAATVSFFLHYTPAEEILKRAPAKLTSTMGLLFELSARQAARDITAGLNAGHDPWCVTSPSLPLLLSFPLPLLNSS